MKRLLLICLISLLFVSGWSHVLAAGICPKAQAISHCPMQTETKSASAHESARMDEMGDMQMRPAVAGVEANALEQPAGLCPHCFKQPAQQTSPAIASNGAEQSRRNPAIALRQAVKVFSQQATSFATPVSSKQHAPPQASTPRHVLISFYLI